MQITHENTADYRTLIKVSFDRESPNPARSPTVEVVFEYIPGEDFTLEVNPILLVPLSVTRSDTREPMVLTDDERRLVFQEAASYAGRL
jgi:hypothetical protein